MNIDDDVLAAVKELAKSQKSTASVVISALARQALTAPHPQTEAVEKAAPVGTVWKDGWYVLPSWGGAPITSEMIQRLLDEADLEDAGLCSSRPSAAPSTT